ncbi:hypothetical protein BDM02DRAFT_3191786 [Thelephora ganbajun]|uniref:Uncharacterized protein n=1 Tax=Thelephora ganbajun TaxID=370292 RepID=A0ACB6Z2J4_THEGA|nr:hypothetical protein BDM02DRAFT_3191786 [Thelephora ganbajun]
MHSFLGSRLLCGAQESRVGSGRQELIPRPHASYQSQIFPSSAPVDSKGNEWVGNFPNEQNGHLQYNSITGETARTMGPSAISSSEQVQDNPMTALQQAQALIAASDSEVPTRPPKSWGTGKSTDHGHTDRQKGLPSSIREDQPVVHPLPPSLRRSYGSREEPSPTERHPHPAHPGDERIQPLKMQEQSPRTDSKDRPLTVRDMEHFTKAIQDTIQQMGSEFIEALAEMHRSEDFLEDYEDE